MRELIIEYHLSYLVQYGKNVCLNYVDKIWCGIDNYFPICVEKCVEPVEILFWWSIWVSDVQRMITWFHWYTVCLLCVKKMKLLCVYFLEKCIFENWCICLLLESFWTSCMKKRHVGREGTKRNYGVYLFCCWVWGR